MAAFVILSVAVGVPRAVAVPALAAPDTCYATLGNSGTSPGHLIKINRVNGAGTDKGPTNIVSATGDRGVPALAIKSNGEMYAMETGANARLYRLDANNGAWSDSVRTSLNSPPAIAFDGNDVLWAADITGVLYTLNPTTGAATSRGATGVAIRGLAFDPLDGKLWASDDSGRIYTIDVYTGIATLVGSTGQFASPDLEFDQAGNLFASSGGGVVANQLIKINKTTPGASTVVGPINFSSVAGMAARLTRALPCPLSPVAVAFVNPGATGAGSGTSWADAYTDLRRALSAARCGTISEIWVKAGTYKPTPGTDRAATFRLRSGLAIYGGFAGTESARSQRNWAANLTILSGDIGTPGTTADNNLHVVTGSGTDTTAVLDGFTVTAGQGSTGGGMINNVGSPAVTNVIFTSNAATVSGGGVYNNQAAPRFANVRFSNNRAPAGGGMYNTAADVVLTNATFSYNLADYGSGICNDSSAPVLTNVIVWGNAIYTYPPDPDPPEPQIYNQSSTPVITYSDIQGSGGVGTGNLDADPLFVYAAGGDLQLQFGSPAIDTGNPAAVPAGVTRDLAGNPRIFNLRVDMGAYESQCRPGPLAYVRQSATGSGDGTSWANAYTSLQAALTAAQCGGISEIWVAAGTYKPTPGTDRAATFQLRSGLAIYGGFAGTETARSQRNWAANPTILSGEIREPGNADNSYHVVTGSGTDTTAVLDGFAVTAGNANNGQFPQGCGGGMINDSGSPAVTNVSFANNATTLYGGGVFTINGAPRFTNVMFTGNTGLFGGGMFNWISNARVVNATFSGNIATNGGGGIYNYFAGAPVLTSVIVWGNTAPTEPQIYNQSSTPVITYSDIQGSGGGGTGNLDADPLFVNAAGGDLKLRFGSPAIDAGNPAAPAGVTRDLAGNPRITNVTVDMGAYEYFCPPGPVAYVKQNAVGSGAGTSWANAYTSLQAALGDAQCGGISEIWVAAGTHRPTADTSRAATFQLRSGLAIYGGFAGTETARAQRDWKAHLTILSGEIGAPGNADNSYHVVTGSGTIATAVLDGFTVTAGNANGNGVVPFNNRGGGMLCSSGRPALTNVIFASNAALSGGGVYNINTSAPVFMNVLFTRNAAQQNGGGIQNDAGSSPSLVNAVLDRNTAASGGGMYNSASSPTLMGVTFAGNAATVAGGGMNNASVSGPVLGNTILWGNTAPSGPQILNSGSTPVISYSDIQGSGGSAAWVGALGTNGGNNVDADPRFKDAALGNLRLVAVSPAINTGSTALVPVGVTIDADGNVRVSGAAVDMGAFEYSASTVAVDDDPASGTPVTVALRSVYPNPLNRSVNVSFDLERRRSVRVGVYDVQGRLVRGLLDEVRDAGRHTVGWNRTDDGGRQVPRGLYFLLVRSEGWSAQRKLIVVN